MILGFQIYLFRGSLQEQDGTERLKVVTRMQILNGGIVFFMEHLLGGHML